MNGSKVLARRIHLAVAWIFLVAILIQVFLIGLYLFAGGSLEPHRSFGYSILFVALAVLLTALWARVPRRDGWIAAGVLGLYIVQTSLQHGTGFDRPVPGHEGVCVQSEHGLHGGDPA